MKLTEATLDKNIKPEDVRSKLVIFTFVAVGIFAILISRLWFMQVVGGQKYMNLAEGNYIRAIHIEAPRGLIYDRNGKVLVNNRPSIGVLVSPDTAEKYPESLNKLSKILKMPLGEIKKKLTEKKYDPLRPRVVKRDIDDKTLAYIEEHKSELPGVDIITESIRGYPHVKLGAHIFGYLGEISQQELAKLKSSGGYDLGDIIGKSGIESTYEGILRGQKGSQQIEVNAIGKPLKVIKEVDPIPGRNLVLTVDLDIQKATEEALEETIKRVRKGTGKNKFKADGAAAVVLDPRNGEVLALASYPTYDPELFVGGISKKNWQELIDKDNHYPLNNRALMAFPPGSTFKPVTLMGGLADDLVKRTEKFVCSGRWYGMGAKWVKRCWDRGGHGKIGLISGMAESCDIVFYEIGYRFYKQTKERLQHWAREFGFGSHTGIDLPSEAKGRVPTKEWKKEWNKNFPEYQKWFPGDTVNIAIGQGDLLTTPVQLASFYAAIANGGTLYRPHLKKAMISWDGNIKVDYQPKIEDKQKLDISKDIIKYTRTTLERVTANGTAGGAFAGFPEKVAGKTGTAEVRGKDDYAWFVGYAPAEEPKYVVVVLVEQGGHGGSTAAPAARKILAAALGYEDKGPGYVYDPSR